MRKDTGPWVPLFQGEQAAQVCRGIESIIEALRGLEVDRRGGPAVCSGRAGTAVLWAYLARAFPERQYEQAAATELYAATAAVATLQLPPGLYCGFPGIGWAVEHLRDQVPGIDSHSCDGIDAGVLAWLGTRGPWKRDYDLISGLVGIGVYALERLPYPGGTACLERVVQRLAETAEEQTDGTTWWTPPELLTAATQRQYPRGYYNVGLAHGVPGVVALLSETYAAGVAREQVGPLLAGAVRWLLARRQPTDAGAGFPAILGPELPGAAQQSRLAWCYGDPGVAAALLAAGRCLGEPRWEAAALEIARQAARRPLEQAGVRDAGLCHGAAGLGHLFNRFYQASGELLLAQAARSWFLRALAMRQTDKGLGGYLAWGRTSPMGPAGQSEIAGQPEPTWTAEPGLLTGVTGIALALLGSVSPIEPNWDRLLLSRL